MNHINPAATTTIAYYYPLLLRYATIVTGDRDEAEKIARNVLKDQYQLNGLAPSKLLRLVLKTDVLNRCLYFKQFQIFDRPPIKIPVGGCVLPEEEEDNNPSK
ncbi:MAG: hypothetical protein KGM16_05405 [Bacteroidota bacterium]|nr:hypothetical protein [Bacteroidota bacterium]